MPLFIVRDDITTMQVDAIVNAAKESLLGGGGVDGQIHQAAGPGLLKECRALGGCATGQVKLTKGYNLPARYIIHAVGPVWQGGNQGERELLASCYLEALTLAHQRGFESIAFPLISSGIYGYPKRLAMEVAADTIRQFLNSHDMVVYLALFDKQALDLGRSIFQDIQTFIDEKYVEDRAPWLEGRRKRAEDIHSRRYERRRPAELTADDTLSLPWEEIEQSLQAPVDAPEPPAKAAPPPLPQERSFSLPRFKRGKDRYQEENLPPPEAAPWQDMPAAAPAPLSLEDILSRLDEGFSQTLLRLIDLSGMTDPECYKKANVSRKLFSKIRGDIHYRPSKQTALAFCLALEMDLHATQDLLRKAGYALSPSSKADLIVEYFIRQGNYDIFQINEALFAYDQVLLGA